jgi:sulfur carrier protein
VFLSPIHFIEMQIWLNNFAENFEDKSLHKFLENKQLINKKGIAIAVNEYVIPKNKWETTSLNEGDKITIIQATAGGQSLKRNKRNKK